jgi:hypothetical protein
MNSGLEAGGMDGEDIRRKKSRVLTSPHLNRGIENWSQGHALRSRNTDRSDGGNGSRGANKGRRDALGLTDSITYVDREKRDLRGRESTGTTARTMNASPGGSGEKSEPRNQEPENKGGLPKI